MNDIQTSAGSAFWAARGVRIEPEPVEDELLEDETAEDEPAGEEASFEPEAALEAAPETFAAAVAEPVAEPEPALAPEPAGSTSPSPFIPAQTSFDEVEPQSGEPVDGLVALNETLIDTARAKAELAARKAEPVWQLTDDNLAALPDLRTCLEAILLVVDEPVTEVVLAQIVERPTEQVSAALRALSAEYTSEGRGFDLREVGIGDGSLITQTGWRFYTRA